MNKFILIGLGNPGKKYENTRHNAGKRFVEAFANTEYRILNTEWKQTKYAELAERKPWVFATSKTFMNESGKTVISLLSQYRWAGIQHSTFSIQYLFIAHDDLDIPFGTFKIQFGKGPKLHKGIASIEQALGTKEFWRIRVGIDNRIPNTEYRIPNDKSMRQRLHSEFSIQHSEFLRHSGEDYVLSNFKREERKTLETEVFPRIKVALIDLISN